MHNLTIQSNSVFAFYVPFLYICASPKSLLQLSKKKERGQHHPLYGSYCTVVFLDNSSNEQSLEKHASSIEAKSTKVDGGEYVCGITRSVVLIVP